ncbi:MULTISPECIES: hypothetical protein [unclassified Microcoleus]
MNYRRDVQKRWVEERKPTIRPAYYESIFGSILIFDVLSSVEIVIFGVAF